METVSNHNPQFFNPIPLKNKTGYTKGNRKSVMEKLKEALIKFADSNPSLFRHDDCNSYPSLIEQRFSQFFVDFQTPNHPPYAAMIHKAIEELNEKRGSSEESISKHIKQEHADLPWAHSTLLKHHLEKLCDRKEITITHKQRYLLPDVFSDPISISTSKKQSKRKQTLETEKKCSRKNKKRKKSKQDTESGKRHKKYKKKEKELLDLQETKKQINEVFQEQDQVLPLLNEVADEQETEKQQIENQTYEEGNNLIDVCIEEMEEGGVCENNEEEIEIKGKKKRKLKKKSKRRGKRGKKNEETQVQALSDENVKQENEVKECELREQNKGKRVWTKSQIKKSSKKEALASANMPKDVDNLGEEKQEETEMMGGKEAVFTQTNGQRAKLRSFEKKKGKSNDKVQKKRKTCGRLKVIRRSSRKRKAPSLY